MAPTSVCPVIKGAMLVAVVLQVAQAVKAATLVTVALQVA